MIEEETHQIVKSGYRRWRASDPLNLVGELIIERERNIAVG